MWVMATAFDKALLALFPNDLAFNLFDYQSKILHFCISLYLPIQKYSFCLHNLILKSKSITTS